MESKKIDLFYDLMDSACMLLYDKLKLNYIQALIRVCNDLVNEIDEKMLDEEAVKSLQKVYNELDKMDLYSEEIRIGLQLLIIKGFKHINYSLDLMTPDSINYLIAHIIRQVCGSNISIIDTALGTGNMLNTILNYEGIEVTEAFGIENDEILVSLSKACSDLQNNGITIYYQNAENPILDLVDVVVGDLPNEKNPTAEPLISKNTSKYSYLPYQIISQRQNNIKEDGFFIYLIDNDFFSQSESEAFRKEIQTTSTLLGLFVIDREMFKKDNIGKSILVGQKKNYQAFDMLVANIKLSSKEDMIKMMNVIDKWANKIKEE